MVGGQRHAPAVLPPGMTRYPLDRRLGAPQGRCGRVRKISPPPGSDSRTVQPEGGHFHTYRNTSGSQEWLISKEIKQRETLL